MPGTLTHSPADVLRDLLIGLAVGTAPSAAGNWPIFVAGEPDTPDNCITVYDTAGTLEGRSMIDGEKQEHHGIQIRVRANDYPTGYTKARTVATTLDTSVYQNSASIGASVYVVQSVSRTTDVIPLGKENPLSKRDLFTINALVSLTQTS